MKKTALLALALAAILLAGCCCPTAGFGRTVDGSGRLATEEMDLTGFSRIEAGQTFVLEVTQGSAYSVSVTADDNLRDYLDISVSGATLHLRLKPGYSYTRTTLRAKVSLPSLSRLSLSGASRGTISGIESREDLAINLSGASSLSGAVSARQLRLESSGASHSSLRGAVERLVVSGSGASTIDLPDLAVSDSADVRLSGASRADLLVDGRLDVELSGGSRLEYAGRTTLGRVYTSGGSSLNAH